MLFNLGFQAYVSPINVLCNESGCLTRITDSDQTDLISFDEHHLTPIASRYLAKVFHLISVGPVMLCDLFSLWYVKIPSRRDREETVRCFVGTFCWLGYI